MQPLWVSPARRHGPCLRRRQPRRLAVVVPVMPVSQALLLSGVLVGAGLLIFAAAALPRLWHHQP